MITHVAIIWRGATHSLPKPKRHHHIVHLLYLATGDSVDHTIQGFLDDQGNFLNRTDALIHARACGQQKGPNIRNDDWLYSEDIW